MSDYPYLFKPGKIGRIPVKNRVVMAPMGDVMANLDGSVSDQMIAYYTERAKGGAGIIIPGFFCVDCSKETSGTPGLSSRIDGVKYVRNLALFAKSVHRYGALLIPQIAHAGAQTTAIGTEGVTPVCVSDKEVEHILIKLDRKQGPSRELKTEEIPTIIKRFIDAARHCQTAGCDGVQIHCSHGYLISQFLSPHTNIRTDQYGGSLENRMRFALEVIWGIRKKCGPDFIIGVRTPGRENVPNGLSDEECQTIAKTFEEAGCDFIDISIGQTTIFSQLNETQNYDQGSRNDIIAGIKKVVTTIPVMSVSMLREPSYCNKLLEEQKLDFVCLGRPLICDPYWPQKARTGKAHEIRKCISCLEGCNRVHKGQSISCALNPAAGGERESELKMADKPKKVVVIGGGPGGMQTAVTSAQRGHDVILLEKSDKLGGQLNLACVPPHKEKISWATDWFSGELVRQGVDVRLGCAADVKLIKSLQPDVVIAATGATPFAPSIPGIEKGIQSWDLLNGSVSLPENKNVAIIGGGIVGCEVAEMLAEKGNKVIILEMLPQVAAALEIVHKFDMFALFKKLGIKSSTSSVVKRIESDGVVYEKDGAEMHTDADMVVLAIGQKPFGLELIEQLEAEGLEVVVVGDAYRPAKIIDAVQAGFYAALNI